MEHHSNFVPWQELSKQTGCALKIVNITNEYLPDYRQLGKIITRITKLLVITSMSNVLGTIVDIPKVIQIVKRINPAIVVLVDAAQSIAHMPVDVSKWGADFVAFSGHKMLGPTGIGVLWGRKALLEEMKPFQFGGDMISEVHLDRTEFAAIPHKFEAGTPNIAGAIGLGAAVSYLSNIGMNAIREHEINLTAYALIKLKQIK